MFFDKVGTYWMKGVNFPLDIVFVDERGVVLEKQAMYPSTTTFKLHRPSSNMAAHAIELPHGWVDRNGIRTGDRVRAVG
jgi:uncharacterized membrane protein (UPF0127 family)